MMHQTSCLLVVAGLARALSLVTTLENRTTATDLSNSTLNHLVGKAAQCVSGNISIPIQTINTKLLLLEPANQTIVTELIQELVQVGSTIAARTSGGSSVVSGSYRIGITLCYPANVSSNENVHTVQVLTNGAGFDKSYWDIAPGFSYVDAAADAGYATVAYDRLGVGVSDYPDPLQVVQCPADVEIRHGVVRLLRTEGFASKAFKRVIGVGHSYGSIVQLAHNAKYPKDVDATILTGFVNNLANFPYSTVAFNPSIARSNDPSKFGKIDNGYLVHDTRISVQLPYFRHPFYDFNSKQPNQCQCMCH